MSPDLARQFLSKNVDRIPAGENVLAVLAGDAEGGAMRRALVEAGSGTALQDYEERERARAEERRQAATGDAALWPPASTYWLVLTDEHLHVFEGNMNGHEAGPGAASFPRERIAGVDHRRKLLISQLTVRFADGSSVGLDVGRRKVKPFLDAMAAGRSKRRS